MSEGLDIAKLRRIMIVSATVGVFVIALISASSGILPLFHELRSTQQNRLQQVVQTRSRAIEQFLERARSVSLQITSRTRARRLLENYNRGELEREQYVEQSVVILRDALRSSNEVRGITRLDVHGEPVASVGRVIPPEAWPDPPAPGELVSTRGPIELDGKYALVLRAGIVGPDGRQVGTDVVSFSLETVRRILAGRSGLGASGVVRMLALSGEPMVLLVPAADEPLVLREAEPTLVDEAAHVLQEHVGELIMANAGDKLLHVFGVVQGTRWLVVASMNPTELYAPVTRQVLWTTALAAVLALAGAAGMVLLLRPLTEDMLLHSDALKQRVREATAELEERNALLHAANDELAKHNQRFEQELKLAHSVQTGFLPKHFPRRDHVEFDQYYLTCEILGGDLFDVFEIDSDHIGMYIADVSGHGVRAALISGLLRMAVSSVRDRNAAPEGRLQVDLLEPGEVILALNRLLKDEIPEFDFVTMQYAVLDLRTHRIRIANAGHPAPVHIAAAGRVIETWEVPTGGALGISDADQIFPTMEKSIAPQDKVVFYTDGLTEALNPEGEEFGEERFLHVLEETAAESGAAMQEAIREAVHRHRKLEEVSDDFCLLIAEIKQPPPESMPRGVAQG